MGGIWEGETHTKWPLRRGRPRGGGDPRVACRGQAGVLDDGSKMMCGKSESEMWRLQINMM